MIRQEQIAKIIFDWLKNDAESAATHPSRAPFTFNKDEGDLTINVDGELNCRALAAVIDKRLTEMEKK